MVGRFSNLNAQYHILSYLGPVWGCFDCVGHMDDCPECVPRFNDTQVRRTSHEARPVCGC